MFFFVAHCGACATESRWSPPASSNFGIRGSFCGAPCPCATENRYSVAHLGPCATKSWHSVAHGGRCATECELSVAHGIGAPQNVAFLWRMCQMRHKNIIWCATKCQPGPTKAFNALKSQIHLQPFPFSHTARISPLSHPILPILSPLFLHF